MKNPSYIKIEKIRKQSSSVSQEVVKLLYEKGKRLRQDDGKLVQVTISIPGEEKDLFVVGLRYSKRDGSLTEDHFICRKYIEAGEEEIEYHNKNKLEKMLCEYKGTHKQQFANIYETGHYISVNTISNLYNGSE